MDQRFTELGYRLPDGASKEYASVATAILTDLIAVSPTAAVNVMEPSSVLLFGGLRGISPYHQFSAHVSPKDRQAFDRTLSKYGVYRVSDNAETNKFSLISDGGIRDIKDRYTAVADDWLPPSRYDVSTITEWIDSNVHFLENKLEKGELPPQWQRNSKYTAQHLQFGMLLGYPGRAISSAMWGAVAGDPSGMNLTTVIVADGMPYYGTEVSYDVDPSIINHVEIRGHQKLWSETILAVYRTLQLKELMKNRQFALSYKQIRR